MRLDLSLVLALATKANAFLRNEPGRMEVLAGHPAFAKCHDLSFIRQAGLAGELIADGSLPWFRRLRKEEAVQIRPTLAGMGTEKSSDTPWGVLTESDRGLELWSPSLVRRFNGHDDLQPYRLTMTSARYDRRSLQPITSVEQASRALQEALGSAQVHLAGEGQTVAAAAIGKFSTLHEIGSPHIEGDLASIAADLLPCALPLFASATRVLALLEATGWLNSSDVAAREMAKPLWNAVRGALEAAA